MCYLCSAGTRTVQLDAASLSLAGNQQLGPGVYLADTMSVACAYGDTHGWVLRVFNQVPLNGRQIGGSARKGVDVAEPGQFLRARLTDECWQTVIHLDAVGSLCVEAVPLK